MTGLEETKTCDYCGKKAISNWNACEDCLDKFGDYIEINKKGFDHREFQPLFEIYAARDWARELNTWGHSVADSEIKKNDDDPPDIFAEMDGEPICVEVTRFIDERTQKFKKEILAGRKDWALWPRERFQKCLREAVQEKDSLMKNKYGKGRVPSVHKQFLLLVTDELYLGEDVLDDYLTDENKVTVPRPHSFDAVYMMGVEKYGPETNPVETRHPVFEVSLS